MLKLDPIWQPDTQQATFRTVLNAMAHPGRSYAIQHLPAEGVSALGILAMMLDAEVSLADPHSMLSDTDWPMLQAKSAPVEAADYIIANGCYQPDFSPKLGTLPSPENSATVLISVNQINAEGCCLNCSGPGILDTQQLTLSGLNPHWLSLREEWVASFPLGVDILLFDDRQLVALPRSTRVEVL